MSPFPRLVWPADGRGPSQSWKVKPLASLTWIVSILAIRAPSSSVTG